MTRLTNALSLALPTALMFSFLATADIALAKDDAARKAAKKQCDDAYKDVKRDASFLKGRQRSEALARARQIHKNCTANLPK